MKYYDIKCNTWNSVQRCNEKRIFTLKYLKSNNALLLSQWKRNVNFGGEGERKGNLAKIIPWTREHVEPKHWTSKTKLLGGIGSKVKCTNLIDR